MIQFAVLGCGRIGRMHADNLAAHARAELVWAFDVQRPAAVAVAEAHGCRVAGSVGEALADGSVDAVLIASSTDTHVELITAAAKAGQAILCEKPIDLDIAKVDACWQGSATRCADPDRLQPPLRPLLQRRPESQSAPARSATCAR